MDPVIQAGLDQLIAQNQRANEELSASLRQLRERLASGFGVPGVFPEDIPYEDGVELQRRQEIWTSRFLREMIAAMALDPDFREEAIRKSQEILRARGRLPSDDQDGPGEDGAG